MNNLEITVIKMLIHLVFILLGIVLYYVYVCVFNDCKLLTTTGVKNIIPLESFVTPFQEMLDGHIMNGLKILFSFRTPWLYVCIMLVISNIITHYSFKKQKRKNKQLSLKDLYNES